MTRPLAALFLLLLGLVAAGCSESVAPNPGNPAPIVEWAPNGSPENIAISPDGTTIAARLATEVVFYKAATGDSLGGIELRPFCGCDEYTPANVAFSPDGKQVAAGILSDLYLIDVPDGTIRDTLAVGEPFMPAHCLSFGSDGLVYVNTQRGTLSVWDSATGARLLTHPRDPDFFGWTSAISPDGRTIAVGGNVGGRQAIRLFDASDLSHYTTLLGDSGFVINMAFSSSSSSRLVTGALFAPHGQPVDQRLTYWDLTQSRPIWTIKSPSMFVNALALSPDGTLVATGWTNGEMALISTRAGGVILRWDAHARAGAYDCVFFPDGHALVTSGYDNMIKEWDIAGLLARRGI
jgi:WD40 repeat protein